MGKRAGWARRLKQQVMRSRWGQACGARWGYVLEPERWVFVLGCYNSGTTLLKDLLAEHPHMGVLAGEGVKFSDALPRPEDFGWQRMWCECFEQMQLDPMDGARAERIKRQWSMLYPSRPNLLEKSIANVVHMPFLEAQFAPAYFVYIVRNGYAVAEGIRRKTEPGRRGNPIYRDRYPIELCARQWAESDRLFVDQAQQVDRCISVRYEDFVEDPGRQMRLITDFVGIEPLPNELLERRWTVHGVESSIRNMNPDSIARLSEVDIAAVHETAGERLAAWGYARPDRD